MMYDDNNILIMNILIKGREKSNVGRILISNCVYFVIFISVNWVVELWNLLDIVYDCSLSHAILFEAVSAIIIIEADVKKSILSFFYDLSERTLVHLKDNWKVRDQRPVTEDFADFSPLLPKNKL